MNIKELKSIELSSYTLMNTAISVIFSIIATVILIIAIGAFIPDGVSLGIYLIPTLIIGTFMYGIYNNFTQGLLYNLLAKKLKTIAIAINDGEIVKISTTETSMMIAIILTIQVILLYLVSVFVLPIFLTSVMQTLMFSGQEALAYSVYQLVIIISQPATIAIMIFATFIVSLVFTLIGTYLYNFLASKGRGIILNLNSENGLTAIESVDALRLAIVFAIIIGVLQLILGIISMVSGGNALTAVGNIIGGFVSGFISFYIMGFLYNFLAGKIGKIKIELIDLKIN